jgi:hypothetical protein
MTLAIAAEIEPNTVVLSADSRGLNGNRQPLPDPVEKLFTRARPGGRLGTMGACAYSLTLGSSTIALGSSWSA